MRISVLSLLSVVCAMLVAQTTDNQPLKLRVGTYNVGHFNQGKLGGYQGRNSGEELQRWKDWISEQSLDIFITNEWNSNFDKDSIYDATKELLEPLYKYNYFGKENRWIFNGISTNYKLQNIRQIDWFKDYYAIIGDLVIGNKTITVMSTHIPWQVEGHLPAMEAMIKEMQKYEYIICMGDMNATDQVQMKFVEAGFNMANGGYQSFMCTAPYGKALGKPHYNIDNIVTSKNIKILNASAPISGLTSLDHSPVLADIIITW